MLRTTLSPRWANHLVAACATVLVAVALTACGGGSGGASGGCTTIDPSRPSSLPGCGTGTGTPSTGRVVMEAVMPGR